MNMPVNAVCDYPYPTYEQAICAGSEIYKKLTGQSERDMACMTHCCYTVAGFGLSAIPHSHEDGMQAVVADGECPTEEQMAEAFKPLHEAYEKGVQGVGDNHEQAQLPWATIITIAFQLLQQWWKNRQK